MKKDGRHTLEKQPQVMNVIPVSAPRKLWLKLLWAKLKVRR